MCVRMWREVDAARLPVLDRLVRAPSRSTRPIASSSLRSPSEARISRTSSARKKKKLTMCSGVPAKRLRSSGSCVAMPTGHVLRWQARIMMHPAAISGAVEKPISSAPRSDAMTTSRPVFSWPSVCTKMRERRSLRSSVCWVSARPISQGTPADWIEESGEAPVPPSWPEMSTRSAFALETPAATVPTPTSETSFTETCALRVRAAQVVDQLLEVLDRVDVVVRRRRDEPDAGRRVADRADVLVDLVAGELAALAGLCSLRHLDLKLVGVDEVVDRDAEAPGGDLLDRRAPAVAVGVGLEAHRVLAALARVRLAAEAVHRDRERLVGLARDRAEAHRAGAEALDDLARGLDLLERNRLAPRGPQLEQPAQRGVARRFVVDDARVLAELRIRGAFAHRLVGAAHRRRSPGRRARCAARTACWTSAIVSGFQMWRSPSRRQA